MPSIITYNVNGIRSALRKNIKIWIKTVNADIICLQEIKANVDQFDVSHFKNLGYHCYWHSAEKKGYSGVAILTRQKPINVEYGCGINEIDAEGRVIRVDFKEFSVMSLYFPSGSSGYIRQSFKMDFLKKFNKYINAAKTNFPSLVLSGDFNICHKEIDIHNPISNKNSSGFLPEERQWMTDFLSSGFIDSFRINNQTPHNYTWWSYRANARVKNLGWRIDYHLISENLLEKFKRCEILTNAKHSDHCPVLLEINN